MDFAKFVEKNIEHSVAMAKLMDISLTLNVVENDEVFVQVSEAEFGLAIRNLLANAVKFTNHGGKVEARVVMRSGIAEGSENDASDERPLEFIRLEVADSGEGMAKEKQQSLMDEIARFAPTVNDTEQGHGVGFFVCHGKDPLYLPALFIREHALTLSHLGIVKLHGGRVGVFSEGIGKGSTFFIEMPIVDRRRDLSAQGSQKMRIVHMGSSLRLAHKIAEGSSVVNKLRSAKSRLAKVGSGFLATLTAHAASIGRVSICALFILSADTHCFNKYVQTVAVRMLKTATRTKCPIEVLTFCRTMVQKASEVEEREGLRGD
jgi:hypothetical protein